MSRRALSRSFFARDSDVVARDLLGRILVHELDGKRLACRLVETESYFGPAGRNPHLAARHDMPSRLRARLLREGDPASHSFPGVTARNRVMYGAPGVAYVYLIYGVHECMNVVTGPARAHEPQAVLLRAGEPVEGGERMMARRGVARAEDVASGPAKLAKAMGITRAHDGQDVTRAELREAHAPAGADASRRSREGVQAPGPRSGRGDLHFEEGAPVARVDVTPRIGVAGAKDLPLRFAERGSRFASRRGAG